MKAWDFKLKNVDGRMIGPEDYPDAKGFIVVFTCNHCPYAIAYEKRINDLAMRYEPLGYSLLAINVNDVSRYPQDSFEHMQERAKARGFVFPYLHDESQQSAHDYQALRTPHAYVLHRRSPDQLELIYQGAIDDNWEHPGQVKEKYIEQVIDTMIAQQPVLTAQTEPVGCSIKWKE